MKWPWNKPKSITPEEFWAWFLTESENIKKLKPESIQNSELTRKLQAVLQGLAFGMALAEEPAAFEVSADGVSALVPVVQRLVDAAPQIPGWRIFAFRQPTPGMELQISGTRVSAETVYWSEDCSFDGGIDITVFLPLLGLRDKECFQITALILDHTIGEYAAMTKIRKIAVVATTQMPAFAKPLTELPVHLSL
jgi:hypothetical protein